MINQEDEKQSIEKSAIHKVESARREIFNEKTDYIKMLIAEIGKSAEDFFADKLATSLFAESSENDKNESASLEQVLYFSFLETVRQVSAKSKT